jgi:hypothetical protein
VVDGCEVLVGRPRLMADQGFAGYNLDRGGGALVDGMTEKVT